MLCIFVIFKCKSCPPGSWFSVQSNLHLFVVPVCKLELVLEVLTGIPGSGDEGDIIL